MRNLTTIATLVLTWLALAATTLALAATMSFADQASATYQLALAANRPPCEQPEDSSASTRCRGTKGTRTTYSIRADTMLWFEQTEPAPVAFLFVGPLAVEPFAYPSPALGIGVQQGSQGPIVEAVFGLQRVVQTVELDRWVQVHLPPHTSFWMQLKPSR